jgi:hypothetical protein
MQWKRFWGLSKGLTEASAKWLKPATGKFGCRYKLENPPGFL